MTEFQAMMTLITRGEIPFNWDMSFDDMLEANIALPDEHPLKDDTSTWDRAYWEQCQAEWRVKVEALMREE